MDLVCRHLSAISADKTFAVSSRINFIPFRIFRGPLFHKPVTGQELIFTVSYSKPALGIYIKLTKLSNLDVISKRRLEMISRSKIFLATQSDHSLYIPSVPRYLRTAFSGSRKSFNLPCFDKEGSA